MGERMTEGREWWQQLKSGQVVGEEWEGEQKKEGNEDDRAD